LEILFMFLSMAALIIVKARAKFFPTLSFILTCKYYILWQPSIMSVKHAYVVGKNNALVDMLDDMFTPCHGVEIMLGFQVILDCHHYISHFSGDSLSFWFSCEKFHIILVKILVILYMWCYIRCLQECG